MWVEFQPIRILLEDRTEITDTLLIKTVLQLSDECIQAATNDQAKLGEALDLIKNANKTTLIDYG